MKNRFITNCYKILLQIAIGWLITNCDEILLQIVTADLCQIMTSLFLFAANLLQSGIAITNCDRASTTQMSVNLPSKPRLAAK